MYNVSYKMHDFSVNEKLNKIIIYLLTTSVTFITCYTT